jgi:hypothetical protein
MARSPDGEEICEHPLGPIKALEFVDGESVSVIGGERDRQKSGDQDEHRSLRRAQPNEPSAQSSGFQRMEIRDQPVGCQPQILVARSDRCRITTSPPPAHAREDGRRGFLRTALRPPKYHNPCGNRPDRRRRPGYDRLVARPKTGRCKTRLGRIGASLRPRQGGGDFL